MKPLFLLLPFCGSVFAAEHTAAALPAVLVAPQAAAARSVLYGEQDVVPVHCQIRFTCLIQLPKNEKILDFVVGDRDFWITNGAENFAYIRPTDQGHQQTSLNLVTAHGNVYSFLLLQVIDGHPDIKLIVTLKEGDTMQSALAGNPRFVPATELENYKAQIDIAQEQVRAVRKAAETTIESKTTEIAADYPGKMKHTYKFKRSVKPFEVTAVFHDDKHTYIQASPEETPALYEMKDGKPNLIQFAFKDGLYTVDKVLDSGYLQIGKKREPITREE